MADVLALGAHPDDVEICCGGLVALLSEQGRQVVIADLTRGEMSTRGSPEERDLEARAAAEELGVLGRRNLDLGDTRLSLTQASIDALIGLLREVRPRIVVGPFFSDAHPDHAAAAQLVKQACYLSGIRKRGTGKPHRPEHLLQYFSHELATPSLIVDISSTFERKMRAVRKHASQLFDPNRNEPQTILSHPQFLERIEVRGRFFGNLIGCRYGEPYHQPHPPRVADLFSLLPAK